MNIQHVTVAGSGVLGVQIAYQSAFHGFDVTLYDIETAPLERAKLKLTALEERYQQDLDARPEMVTAATRRIRFSTELEEAVAAADVVIEAIPEDPDTKAGFYRKLARKAPEKTIFVTNSSTFLPSRFAEDTGRPERFLALHFANEIWKHNTAEIMGHPGTSPEVFETVTAFARAIGMVALPLQKEHPGYIVNSLLIPLLDAAVDLLVEEVATPAIIDKTWMLATGAPMGPCGILDVVGLTTAYNITKISADRTGEASKVRAAAYLKANFIDTGKLGVATGEGFFSYPEPEFRKPDFLKP